MEVLATEAGDLSSILGTTWQKERTDSWRWSSDHGTYHVLWSHLCPDMASLHDRYNKNKDLTGPGAVISSPTCPTLGQEHWGSRWIVSSSLGYTVTLSSSSLFFLTFKKLAFEILGFMMAFSHTYILMLCFDLTALCLPSSNCWSISSEILHLSVFR